MACAGHSCKQGRSKCETPWTCGGYATEAHHDAMTRPLYAPLREQAMSIEMYEPPESAWSVAKRLGGVALLIAAVGAAWAAAVYFPAWPWLVAWLAAI